VKKLKDANRKIREGIVVSNKMSKTVVVIVERNFQHPLYKKVIRKTNKFKAHDEGNVCAIGDKVKIMEVRPLSADKRWIVLEVMGHGTERIAEEDKGRPAHVRAQAQKEKEIDTNPVNA